MNFEGGRGRNGKRHCGIARGGKAGGRARPDGMDLGEDGCLSQVEIDRVVSEGEKYRTILRVVLGSDFQEAEIDRIAEVVEKTDEIFAQASRGKPAIDRTKEIDDSGSCGKAGGRARPDGMDLGEDTSSESAASSLSHHSSMPDLVDSDEVPEPAHAQCTVCFKLQAVMADSAQSIECRRQAAKELQEHHRAQYRDRLLYWNLRLASQCDSDVLVIIIDAMDKAKFAWNGQGQVRMDGASKGKGFDGADGKSKGKGFDGVDGKSKNNAM